MGNIHKTSWREVTELCSSLLNVLELDIRNINAELVRRLRNQYTVYKDNDAKLQELTQKVQEQHRKIAILEEDYQRVRKKHDIYEQ
jgi:Tfp pilus assembly protein PilN